MNEFEADRLSEAIHLLSDERSIVRLAGEALSATIPQGFVKTYTTRGFPARSVGVAFHFEDQMELDVNEDGAAFHEAFLPIIRLAARQPNRWVEVVRDGLVTADELRMLFSRCPVLRNLEICEWGLFVATLGREPIGGGNALLPRGAPVLNDETRTRIEALVPRLSEALRLAALIASASSGLHALDHLLSSRTDAAFLLSTSGDLLGASPAGELALLRHRDLARHLVKQTENASRRATEIELFDLGLRIHITPCSPRGGSSALLAVIHPREMVSNRGRFTQRQAELLDLVEKGLSNKEIAVLMGLSPLTVKSSLEHLYRLADVSGRVALVRWKRGERSDQPTVSPT